MDGHDVGGEAKWLNARKVYLRYGIPRSFLRGLAADGKVRTREIVLPDSGKVMKLYSSDDCKAVVG